MLVDMSDILIVTPVGKKFKKRYLFATVMAMLGNIKNAEWWFLLDGVRAFSNKDQQLLTEMANVNNNKLIGRYYNGSYSLAQMKTEFLTGRTHTRKWVLYVDSDMIVTVEALEGLTRGIAMEVHEHVKLFLLTQFDIVNGRQFQDWDKEIKSVLEMNKVPEQFIAHHLWSIGDSSLRMFNYFMVDKTMSGLYCMDITWFLCNRPLIDEFRQWKKGVRGYGTKISLALKPHQKRFIVPSLAFHLGCTGSRMNNTWDSYYKGYNQEWLDLPAENENDLDS